MESTPRLKRDRFHASNNMPFSDIASALDLSAKTIFYCFRRTTQPLSRRPFENAWKDTFSHMPTRTRHISRAARATRSPPQMNPSGLNSYGSQ